MDAIQSKMIRVAIPKSVCAVCTRILVGVGLTLHTHIVGRTKIDGICVVRAYHFCTSIIHVHYIQCQTFKMRRRRSLKKSVHPLNHFHEIMRHSVLISRQRKEVSHDRKRQSQSSEMIVVNKFGDGVARTLP